MSQTRPVPPFTDPEKAREAQRLGQEAKRRNAERRAARGPMAVIDDALPSLMEDLVKAAQGKPPYNDLPPDKRLAALFRAIEYGAGKPPPASKPAEPETNAAEEEHEAEGVTIT